MKKKEIIIFLIVALFVVTIFLLVEWKEFFPEKFDENKHNCIATCKDAGNLFLTSPGKISEEWQKKWLKNCAYLFWEDEDPFGSDKCMDWEKK